MRVGGSLKPGDTSGASTRVAANDPGVDPRALPVATVVVSQRNLGAGCGHHAGPGPRAGRGLSGATPNR